MSRSRVRSADRNGDEADEDWSSSDLPQEDAQAREQEGASLQSSSDDDGENLNFIANDGVDFDDDDDDGSDSVGTMEIEEESKWEDRGRQLDDVEEDMDFDEMESELVPSRKGKDIVQVKLLSTATQRFNESDLM